jgi:non-specific serine/threonine protein kinase
VYADLHPGNILATIPPLGEPLSDTSLEPKLQQPPSEGTPLVRRDGKADLWAPPYLLAPAPLQGHVSFELNPVVKLADLGAAFFEHDPPPTVVTPVALRAPETILRGTLPLGKGIDLWVYGCLMFELLTGRTLFVRLEALDGYEESDEDTNDEHLIQLLSEVLGPLPAELALHWRRRDRYYGPDGKRLGTTKCGGSGDEGSDTDGDDSDGKDEALPPDSPASETSRSASSSLVDQDEDGFAPLEIQLRDGKPDDMDEEEV